MSKIIRRHIPEVTPTFNTTLHPVLQRVYAARGVTDNEVLDKRLETLYSYQHLQGIEQAVSLLAAALQAQKSIIVLGDFDADGATSCALAVSALTAMGAQQVNYLVPNRFEYGYGLTPEIVDVAHKFNPDVLITVDNGITSHAGVLAAKNHGMQVVITDHHLPGESLPPADAIVNPNVAGDAFPSKNLAGVGVIFYVMLALRTFLRNENYFALNNIPEPNMGQFLDLVALGTVADVVPLDKNNRTLVHQGLQRIKAGRARPGINALLAVANRNLQTITASDLAFAAAPRLNAAGRLDDMALGITCLLTPDYQRALEIAKELDALNQERRLIETDMQEQAFAQLQQFAWDKLNACPLGVCLFQEEWHQGVIGILASRIKDKLHRPVVAFAAVNELEIKGSARSIQGVHIRDVFQAIDAQHPGLISKFGGHAMAAGISLLRSNLKAFSDAFAAEVAKHIHEDSLHQVLYTDGELSAHEFCLEVAEILRDAEPWGQAFPEPSFDGQFDLIEQRIVGTRHLKMLVSRPELSRPIDAIAFNIDLKAWPNHRCQRVHLVYRLDINEFNGRRTIQLIVEHIEEA